jgi:hypothetical protein
MTCQDGFFLVNEMRITQQVRWEGQHVDAV